MITQWGKYALGKTMALNKPDFWERERDVEKKKKKTKIQKLFYPLQTWMLL